MPPDNHLATPAAQAPRAVRGRLPLEEMAGNLALLRRWVIGLAWPVAAEMFLHTLTQIVDMMMVARLGRNALAAVGLSFRPMFFTLSIFLGVGAGTTALVARAMGRRQPDEASEVAHQSSLATVVLSTMLAVLFWLLAPAILRFMGAAPEVMPLGVSYMRGLAWGMVFMYTANVLTAALRGAGDTHTSMRVNVVANVLNVFLNYVLIFGHLGFPRLGVLGAAVATSISRAAGGIVIIWLVLRGRLVVSRPKWLLEVKPEVFWRVFRVGVPATAERMLLSVAMILHLKMVAVEGTIAVAAATLAQNIEEISHMPSIGLSVSASALVGQFLGHGRPDAAERSGRECVRIALAFMGLMGLLFVAAPGLWLALYAPEADLVPVATTLVRWTGVAQPFMAVGFVLSGALRGAGDTRSVMYATALSMWVVRLGLTYVFMSLLGWGAAGAWMAMAADAAVRALIMVLVFARGAWKKVKV
ncbi:MAG: MATE family efflux transporter [Bacillota bacterium]|nr:MATE family efflux transporter [Bacillota bacterium]